MLKHINYKNDMKKLYTFDFDGTLTTRDTLLEFIKYAAGRVAFYAGFALYSPLVVLMKAGFYPNYKVKEQLFSYYFRGMEIDRFNEICRNFARDKRDLMRPKGLAALQKAYDDGAEVLVVSASIDNWVAPFFTFMPRTRIVGTQIEVCNGVITGRFKTRNCFGAEKVRRIEELFPHREEYFITAFGDSKGDYEMLDYADKGYFKPFV